MNTILVCGIHGAGKTTLCNLLSKTLSIPYFTASCLINDTSHNLKTVDKSVSDITYNQEKLIKAINTLDYSSIILDGHVTLLDKKYRISRVTISTFEKIGLKALILLDNNVNIIIERLKKRDNLIYPIHIIEEHLNEERSYSEYIAKSFNLPLYICDDSRSIESYSDNLKQLMVKYA